ncbi:MAG: VOC family protein [Xanthobacteraceae bacterium]
MTAARSISFRLNGAPVTADVKPLHHFGLWVDNIDGTKQEIEANGGEFHPGPSATPPANAEHKFRDPNGLVFDISTHGWDGAKR